MGYSSTGQSEQSVEETAFSCSHFSQDADEAYFCAVGGDEVESLFVELYFPISEDFEELEWSSLTSFFCSFWSCFAVVGFRLLELLLELLVAVHSA